MTYRHSQNCAVNSPTMFRNICILALVVLCGQAASAFSSSMIMGMASKMGGQAVSMGMTCLNKNNAADVMGNPTPEKIVHAGGCLVGCSMQAIGLMKADGTINTNTISNAIPAAMPMGAEIKQILTDCGGKGGDTCQSPIAFVKCACADGPMKKIVDTVKQLGTAVIMEVMKSVM